MTIPNLYTELNNVDLSKFMNLDFDGLVNNYPFVKKIYGQELMLPLGISLNDPYWLGYYDQTKGIARLYNFHQLFPDECIDLANQINEALLPYEVKVDPTNVRFGTTKSLVHRHVDEGIRGAINCFIKNGEAAYVNFYNTDNELINQFKTETGKTYFLNTKQIHEVVHVEDVVRYSLTFGIF